MRHCRRRDEACVAACDGMVRHCLSLGPSEMGGTPRFSKRHREQDRGGSRNVPGSYAAIYGSTTPELAMIESLAYQRRRLPRIVRCRLFSKPSQSMSSVCWI